MSWSYRHRQCNVIISRFLNITINVFCNNIDMLGGSKKSQALEQNMQRLPDNLNLNTCSNPQPRQGDPLIV